jgi:hypothetical protein
VEWQYAGRKLTKSVFRVSFLASVSSAFPLPAGGQSFIPLGYLAVSPPSPIVPEAESTSETSVDF